MLTQSPFNLDGIRFLFEEAEPEANCGIGGVLGLGIAIFGVRAFDAAVADSGKPYWIQFTIDYTVIGFLAGVCVLTGILFGLAPALHVSRTNVHGVLKEGGRGTAGGAHADAAERRQRLGFRATPRVVPGHGAERRNAVCARALSTRSAKPPKSGPQKKRPPRERF